MIDGCISQWQLFVIVCYWLLGVGCRILTVAFRVLLSVVLVGSWLLEVAVGGCCWFLIVGCCLLIFCVVAEA